MYDVYGGNMQIETKKRYITYLKAFAAAFALVLLDQFTKLLAVEHLKGKDPLVILHHVFELHYLENRGAAFGIFQGFQGFFILSAVLITAAVIWLFLRTPLEEHFLPLRICGILIVAGAWGNCIDRVIQGYVVDFFYFVLIDFPIFNVADIYVTVAAFALILLLFFYYKEEDLERILHRRKPGRRTD